MSDKLDVATLTRKQQRTDDLRRLNEFLAELPTGHIEKPGVIRAIEVLRTLPLRDDS